MGIKRNSPPINSETPVPQPHFPGATNIKREEVKEEQEEEEFSRLLLDTSFPLKLEVEEGGKDLSPKTRFAIYLNCD